MTIATLALSSAGCTDSTPTDLDDGPVDVAIQRLVVEPRGVTVHVDDSIEFRSYGLSASGDTTDVHVTWSTTSGMIEVKGQGKGNGQYKGKKPGKHDVIATDSSGVADTTDVTVSDRGVALVELQPSEATLLVGATLKLVATPRDEDGEALTGRQVAWTAGDPGIAEVDAAGLVTGAAPGSALVYATVEGQTGSASITAVTPGGLVIVDAPGGDVLSALDLGSARVGTDLAWRTLVVENRGDAMASDMSIVFEDDRGSGSVHFADYQFPGTGGSCESFLGSGSSCTIVVQFSPMAVGGISGVIRADYSEGDQSESNVLAEASGSGTGDVVFADSDGAIREGIGRLGPGMTLIVEDGEYGDVDIVGTSGSSSNPAIIRSRNDGRAHVRSLDIENVSYVQLIGIQAGLGRDGIDGHVVDVKSADHLVLKRLTAHHAQESGNRHVFGISESRYVTVEDCAAWGSGRITYSYYDSEFGVFRRVWGQHLHNESDTWPRSVLTMYYGANSLVENSVVTQAVDADPGVGQIEGFKVNSRNGVRIPDNNTFRGNIAHDIQGPAYYTTGDYDFRNTHFYNNVAVGPEDHYLDTAFDPAEEALDTEVHQHTAAHTIIAVGRASSSSGGDGISGFLVNSIFRSIDRAGRIEAVSWSLFEDVTDLESSLDNDNRRVSGLEFDEAVFGRVGAHLIRPTSARGKGEGGADIGAEILYRYAEVDEPTPSDRRGVLTTIPLWPHPLEERVWRESGGTISITFENRDGRSGLRGVWRDSEALRQALIGR
jgi:hypothetical protein